MFIGERNMLNKVYILGSGGMAREVYQVYKSQKFENKIAGFLINNNKVRFKKILDRPIIKFNKQSLGTNVSLINGIGSPLRRKWIKQLEQGKYRFESVLHKTAMIGDNIIMGKDLIIGANSVLTCDIRVGNHVIINTNVSIGHDCIIGDFATISPGVNIGGGVKIGKNTFIGIGTVIIQGVKIGSNVILGTGSVVVNDIPDNVLAYGNPAKRIRKLGDKDWENLLS